VFLPHVRTACPGEVTVTVSLKKRKEMLDAAKNDKQRTDADRWATTMAGWLSVASRYGAIYLAAAVRTSRPSIVPVPESSLFL
jgi:hypothetical protein